MRPENKLFPTHSIATNRWISGLFAIALVAAVGLTTAIPTSAFAQGQLRQSTELGVDADQSDDQSGEQSSQSEESEQSDTSEQTQKPDQSDTSQESTPSSSSEESGLSEGRGQKQKGNEVDAGTHVVPSIVNKQRKEYQSLENLWNKREVPSPLGKASGAQTASDSGVNSVAISVKNVDFYLDDDVGYHVVSLKGALVPKKKGEPVDFDDPDQYSIRILSGEVLLRPKDLEALMNNYILTYEPRALSSVSMKTSKDTLTVNAGARLFRFIPPVGGLPNTLSGPVNVTKDNKLVYTPDTVKSFGLLPLKPILDATGLGLSTLTPLDRKGIKLEGNKLIFDPEKVFPPPLLEIAKVDSVSLSDAGMRLKFSDPAGDAGFTDPPVPAKSYIWLQSGDAKFYSVVLVNSHLELLGDSDAPLRFNLYHYRAQSAAGTIKAQKDGSLIVRVPNKFKEIDEQPDQNTGLERRSGG